MQDNKCLICLNTSQFIRKLEEIDDSNVSLRKKLQYIAPEVEWLDEYLICNDCSTDLTTAYRFRERCLNVESLKIKIAESEIVINNDFQFCVDDIDSDSSTCCDDGLREEDKETFTCHKCSEIYFNKDDLLNHIEKQHNGINILEDNKHKRNEECKGCGRKFKLTTSLLKHQSVCDGITKHWKVKTKFQCGNCKKYYTTEKILTAHFKKCLEKDVKKTDYQCSACKIYYASSKKLQNHTKHGCRKNESSSDNVKCKLCKEHCKSLFILKRHIIDQHNLSIPKYVEGIIDTYDSPSENTEAEEKKSSKRERKFVCEICNAPFSILKQFFEHNLNVHSLDEKFVKPYVCEICQTRFRTSTNLSTHMLYHKGTRTNICSICGKSFITKNDLVAHEQTHYNRRNYKCDKCGKAFKTNTNLRTHCLIVHTDPSLWKYACQICNKRFPQKSNHDQHFRRHIGEKNFICPICKKPFTSKSEMQEHIGCHSNERAHKCHHCGKEYRKRHTYNVHLSKVHGIGNAKMRVRERKYACHLCPAKFQDKSKLARHLCKHSGLKPFACSDCDKKFTDKSYLNNHRKTFHNQIESVENVPVVN